MKIKEIQHLLDDYQVECVVSKMDDGRVRMVFLPKVLDEKMPEADRTALQNPFILKGKPEELDEEAPAKIIEWVSKLKEGKDNLEQIEKELNKAAEAKKATNKKKAPAKKKAPPRKTAAEKKAEAREAQAKEAEGQGDLFSSGNRLAESKGEPLKTAAEKATEKSLEDDIAELGI